MTNPITISKEKFIKLETIVLSVLLYSVLLVYIYQYSQIAGKYHPWTTDEFFYYIEARAIAAENIYTTPASLDGNTSYIGDFGFHGISYALKDGWLAKLFFHTEDPPLLFINFLTCLGLIALIMFFKRFSLNTRLKIALVVASHYVLYSYTLSYMQETIHYFIAVLALEALYLVYLTPINTLSKHLYYYLTLLVLAITFRYGWFMWGLGLLPFSTNLKSFIKWCAVTGALLVFGVFCSRYILAPYPYNEIVADQIMRSEEFSILNALKIVWNRFSQNALTYITPAESIITTCMRYLLIFLLLISCWYSVKKRERFTIACTLIAWAYFLAALAFYHVYWAYDERALGVLTPILAFSLVGVHNSWIFYLIISIQLLLFPTVIKGTSNRNNASLAINKITDQRIAQEHSYGKMKELITEEQDVVVGISVEFVIHGAPDCFTRLPLRNIKGYKIHYRMFMEGADMRGTHYSKYVMTTQPSPPSEAHDLVYTDQYMCLYRLYY
ncbi:MAG: hypothetical protein WAQ28_07440 [Bacteroidia bacterium]|jgi:hypothetical protein